MLFQQLVGGVIDGIGMGGVVGHGECGWVEVIVIAHGPGWSLPGRRSNHDRCMTHCEAFLFSCFFFSSVSLHIHRRPRTLIHLHYVYIFCSIFNICNVDGMYFKIQMRGVHIEHYIMKW